MNNNVSSLTQLQELVAELRDQKRGCPWILAQNFLTLAAITIEESYELADSAEQNNVEEILDEASDLMLHVALYAQLGKELGKFDLEIIAKKAIEKQLRRKPIFHEHAVKTPEQALLQWEENKRKEREAKNHNEKNTSILDNISHSISALDRAFKLQKEVAKVGFDWPDVNGALEKLTEEIAELKHALHAKENHEIITDELGDLFYTCVNLARHLQINPEMCLGHANNKFEKRFRALEENVKKTNKSLSDLTLNEMDQIWDLVKAEERQNG